MPTPLCGCAFCKNNHEFELPAGLVDDIMSGNVAFFAGAGVSTENDTVLPYSLYEDAAHEIGAEKRGLSFPELMSAYCEQRDGRLRLIKKIRDRFSYIESFLPIYRNATRFHRELATFFPIDTIITTNWDAYFENECSATAFVNDEDMALWTAADRKVLKIHGSIQNLGSIIATTDDYRRSKRALDRGLIGSRLKSIISDKTIVYVGYSYRDDDLSYLNSFISRQLGQLGKQAYIVTLDDSPESIKRYHSARLIPIITDATFFVEQLKQHCRSSYCLMPDEMYGEAASLLLAAQEEQRWLRNTFKLSKTPNAMYSGFYQDGLIHALERVVNLRSTGKYSDRHYILSKIHGYKEERVRKAAKKAYGDICYIDGYMSAYIYLSYIDHEDIGWPPLYYGYGMGEIWDRREFRKALPLMPAAHKAATRFAEREMKKANAGGEEMIIQHLAQI